MMEKIEQILVQFGNEAWGTPLLVLLLGGGLILMLYSRFAPFRYFKHAIDVLRGKYDNQNDPGDINHYQALSSAIAATVGMGNISGVAVAIAMGGPGAIFWMWMSAIVGSATKFFTCSLAVMYRGKDSLGHLEGGPMYVITEGMGQKWKPLAIFFCLAGLFGATPMFQANQLVQVIQNVTLTPLNIGVENPIITQAVIGFFIMIIVGSVILGGIKRIGKVSGRIVPLMVTIYMFLVLVIIMVNYDKVGESLMMIFTEAFEGSAILGGGIGSVMLIGARRAAFSNEAGLGTAPMMHGASKTKEPIREGLVAMLGPAIDTIVVCTLTALAILVTGVWATHDGDGVLMTMNAFTSTFNEAGGWLLTICVLFFALSTLFSYAYYGTKCLSFLIGAERKHWFNYFYLANIIIGSIIPLKAVIGLIDGMYALMAIPTMVSALYLAPRVREEAKKYFKYVKTLAEGE